MELKRIGYKSAASIGFVMLVFNLISGILKLALRNYIDGASGVLVGSAVQELVITPLMGGLLVYIFIVLIIVLYNFIAKKGFTISWEVKESKEAIKKKKK